MPPTARSPLANARTVAPLLRLWRGARWVAGLAVLAVLLWALALVALWFGQERLLFHPVPLADSEPLSREADVSERFVDVPGARLSVLELRRPRPEGVVFFLHGNSGHLKEWFTDGGPYRRANLDLVMMDYRGFGKSSGRIESQAQLQADVEAVWQSVAARYAGLRVIVYGRSLGTGLAAAWAARHQPALTILVSPYESMQALAAQHYPWVPSALLRYPLRSDQALAQVRSPVLLVHGDQDRLIPLAHSQALARQAPQARLVVIPGAAHDDVHRFASYQAVLARALSAPSAGR
ncbi:alpha/beta fold hydrolase [Ideonella sp. 4Y16]|uniref:Alpha/beta fold hydrolase n=1 Tax=Ideonella alba TaxID=2824118 RepID=A0A941BGG5_9BURK|nr:alpha/beta fold hydrolase [Ideonella alba]MBQ0932072.1 alpha/beta fold hydrolase [Ideonella alba]MBQ0945646.1 alpha/beta fold hydrolase [Ideonella alba]